jgi:magnesium transporter
MLHAWCYSAGSWTSIDDLSEISNRREDEDAIVLGIADVSQLEPRDVATIAEEFGLHPLAVEDAVSLRQRPKVERYETHLFAVFHQLDEVAEQLEARQIACFVGRTFVLVLHDRSARTLDDAFKRAQKPPPRDMVKGPPFVMHAVLDAIVDDYQAVADRLEAEIEEIEDIVLSGPGEPLHHRIYVMKQQLARLRRYIVPGERLLASMLSADGQATVSERTAVHFRDVHDHARRIIEQVGNVQALVDAIGELQRTEQANALNEVTKKLTGWAAIVAVPTFIASVYGMNFALVPEEGAITGFFFALGLMVVGVFGRFAYFTRRRWI